MHSAPFSVIHLTNSVESGRVPWPRDTAGDDTDDCSQANTLATLPSYLGKTEVGTEILPLPLSDHITPKAKDTLNLQAILAAPVTATLPLMEFLRFKPEMWTQVLKLLKSKGYSGFGEYNPNKQNKKTSKLPEQKISLNKLNNQGKYRADKGNSMLPVQVDGIKTLAVLDTGAGISIATKAMWVKWGKLSLRKTRMELQLADGNLEQPLGMLENLMVESCGVKYEHTFAIIDFGQDTNYEVILGRPFMRQLRVIQDWGFDYLYLRHDDITTRVNLIDHTYRDIVKTPIDDFDSCSSGLSPNTASSSGYLENALLFQDPAEAILAENKYWTDKALQDEAYILHPFPKHLMDEHEWIHVLAALDTCTIRNGPQFCDDDEHDIIPIQMVNSKHYVIDCEDVRWVKECISITDASSDIDVSEDCEYLNIYDESGFKNDESFLERDDDMVPETELEKVRLLLREREAIELEFTPPQFQCIRREQRENRKQKQAKSKGRKRMPEFSNQTEFLFHIGATDCIKAHKKWKTTINSIHTKNEQTNETTTNSRRGKKKTARALALSISSRTQKESASQESTVLPMMSKTERKKAYKDCKRALTELLQSWDDSSSSLSLNEGDAISVPSNFKRYTIEDRKIKLQAPQRVKPQNIGESYDGPEDAKLVDLAEEGETSKPVYIATDLVATEEELLIEILKQYKDIFAWSYKDLKGVDPKICQHTIPMKEDAKPRKQRPYTYNENFGRKIKEEIDKLLDAEFIYEIEHTEWVSPIVVVPKKNGKLRVCVNLKQVNAATVRDSYPLPITDHVLERVAGKAAYSFLDGFSGYNQVSIALQDQHKTAFATEWGIFAYRVMPFGLTNAPATFQRLMVHAFKAYLRDFLEIFMDDLCIHSKAREDHIDHLVKIFEQCRVYQISLNPEKCKFMVRQGKILGHIVSKNGISTDLEKINVIVDLPRPTNYKGVQVFMGHCGYYRRFIYLHVRSNCKAFIRTSSRF